MWSHSKIQEKKARLEAIRGQLLFDIVVPMASKVGTIPDMTALDTQTRTLLDEIQAGEDANNAMEKRLLAFHQEYTTVQTERHVEIVSLLNGIRDSKPRPAMLKPRQKNVKPRELILRNLLDSLYFRQEIDRFHDIKRAHKGTFDWIYSEPRLGATKATWANFQSWLQHDSGIYWVSGKAGSGKSTLMKMVSNDERTRRHLLHWSAGNRLLMLSFYFWNPGTPLQKSLEGLLRSIISQALKECPELAEKLFPNRFERNINDHHSPTMQELERAFARLTSPGLTDVLSIKLVLLIDGLDEFDAGTTSLTDLAALFTAATRSTSFKAVLSSRPENAFEEAFINCPKLRLHFLTHDDVVKYVNENLHNHPRMVQLAIRSPKESCNLIEEIVEAAQGVFLWVRLVVRSLLEGLQNHDAIDTLTERLRELPSDLEDLFRVMLERVPHRYKRNMSKIFQLVQRASELPLDHRTMFMGHLERQLTALELKFALLGERIVLEAEICPLSVDGAFEEVRSVEAQIKSSCSGLIELRAHKEKYHFPIDTASDTKGDTKTSSATVDDTVHWYDPALHFIHRSVKEYVLREDVWNGILAEAENESFEADTALLQSLVMQAKRCPPEGPNRDPRSFWPLLITALRRAGDLEKKRGTDQLDMMNALETALTARFGQSLWTTYDEHSKEECVHGRQGQAKWHSNFLTFPVRVGLWRYVQARLQIDGFHKPGRPLLDYAFMPQYGGDVGLVGLDQRVVEVLLQHGADPNERFDGFTPWQNAWYSACRERDSRSALLPVLEAFLSYDADPNAYIEYVGYGAWTSDGSNSQPRIHRRSILQVAMELQDEILTHDSGSTCYQDVSRIIQELKRKGAKAQDWIEINGVYVLQKSSFRSACKKALRARLKCILF
ncbi:small s protein [Colletotrichum kahawae]|uniref:Small s protein n=1 Tax=Colletotrichum kahawae TaxID=34407 RepID=A0AAD9YDV5_COLKA|nr:small s protein [Colletotrichum kahawae]